jgi:hypothetical protein
LKLSNQKIKEAIADVEQSCFLLEMLGFEKQILIEEGKAEEYYILNMDKFSQTDFNMLI